MLAYHNDPSIKSNILAQLAARAAADAADAAYAAGADADAAQDQAYVRMANKLIEILEAA